MLSYGDEGYVAFLNISWALEPVFPKSLCKGLIEENQEHWQVMAADLHGGATNVWVCGVHSTIVGFLIDCFSV